MTTKKGLKRELDCGKILEGGEWTGGKRLGG